MKIGNVIELPVALKHQIHATSWLTAKPLLCKATKLDSFMNTVL